MNDNTDPPRLVDFSSDDDDDPPPLVFPTSTAAGSFPARPNPVVPAPVRPAAPVAPVAPVASTRVEPRARARTGQGLALASLLVGIVSALAVGVGVYLALASVRSLVTIDAFQTWLDLAIVGLCGALLAVAGAVVSLVRSRPRTVATLALVGALVLPPIAFLVGAKLGVDVLLDHLQQEAGGAAAEAARAWQSLADQSGTLGRLVGYLIDLFS